MTERHPMSGREDWRNVRKRRQAVPGLLESRGPPAEDFETCGNQKPETNSKFAALFGIEMAFFQVL